MKDKGNTPGSTRALEMGSIQQKDLLEEEENFEKVHSLQHL
jgi:hypothetical protein